MTARRTFFRANALAAAMATAATLGGCVAPGAEPLADRGADGLPEADRLWVRDPDAAAPVDGAAGPDLLPAPDDGPVEAAERPDTTYTVRPGDNLSSIARELTGRTDRWPDIARANGIDDPGSVAVGTRLDIPGALLDDRASGGASDAASTSDDADAFAAGAPSALTGLVDALALAQDHDATFRIARQRFDVARTGVPIARSALLPQASAQAEIARFTDFEDDDDDGAEDAGAVGTGDGPTDGGAGPAVLPVGTPDGDYTETQLSANLSQSLFDRASSLDLSRAELDVDVAETELLAAHEALVVRLAQAYFDVLRSASELEFRESDLEAIGRQLQQSERRYEVGDIAITDVVEARARRDLAQAAEIDARNAVADAREALAEVTGLEPDAIELAELDDDFALVRPDPQDVDAWVAFARRNNLDLATARGQLEAAEAIVGVQRAQRLPTLGVGASVASVDSDDGPREGETGSVALTGTLPLLSGGLVSAQIAQAQAQARLAAEQVTDAERRVTRTARNAYRGVLAAIARVQALAQALASTQQGARAAEAGFEAGTRTSVEVLESLRDTFRARADYAAARYDYILGTLQLEQAAGTLEAVDVRRIGTWLEGS